MNTDILLNGHRLAQSAERKPIVRNPTPMRQTLRSAAQSLSRRNVATAKAELLNETLAQLVLHCYETDDTGALWNVDHVDGRILIGMPTSWRNYQRWGLRRGECDALRAILLKWQAGRLPLFSFDGVNAWHCDIATYPDVDAARLWLHKHQVDAALYNDVTNGRF